jgi:hypothetical protein
MGIDSEFRKQDLECLRTASLKGHPVIGPCPAVKSAKCGGFSKRNWLSAYYFIEMYPSRKLLTWVETVEIEGIEEVRKCGGYHDEPLHGKRRGQHSIRLSKSYRASILFLVESRKLL